MAELMSVRGYAKSRDMAHTSVAYHIKMGPIPLVGGTLVDGKVKGGKIDPEYADHVFAEKVDQRQSLRGRGQRIRLAGEPPKPTDPPSGCAFHPRCPMARPICAEQAPMLHEWLPGRQAACHFALETATAMGQEGW